MKKSMKKLLSLVMVIAALAALTVPALAADAVVSRQGTNGLVIETTGSGYTDTDLFGNFKNVMPGDELTENITIKNNVSGFDYVKLYIRAEAHDEEGNPLTYSEPFENEDGHDQANIDGVRDETVVTMADFLSKNLSVAFHHLFLLIHQAGDLGIAAVKSLPSRRHLIGNVLSSGCIILDAYITKIEGLLEIPGVLIAGGTCSEDCHKAVIETVLDIA